MKRLRGFYLEHKAEIWFASIVLLIVLAMIVGALVNNSPTHPEPVWDEPYYPY